MEGPGRFPQGGTARTGWNETSEIWQGRRDQHVRQPVDERDEPAYDPAGVMEERGPLLVVVVPTYNEAENLPELARRLFALDLPNIRVIVVDDGSPDGTAEVAKRLAREYGGRVELIQRERKLGMGTAYVAGFARALEKGAEQVVQMDADLSHTPEYIPGFVQRLASADVVVGSRYVAGGGVADEWGVWRRFLSALGNFGIRAIVGVSIKDATSGFKAYRGNALASLDLSRFGSRGFAFQAEVAHACQRMGLDVVEHPIIFEARASGRSKMTGAIVVEALWRLVPLRWSK